MSNQEKCKLDNISTAISKLDGLVKDGHTISWQDGLIEVHKNGQRLFASNSFENLVNTMALTNISN